MDRFEVNANGKIHTIHHIEYPRYTAFVDFTNILPQIVELLFHDECSGNLIANAITEINEYIESQKEI